MKYWKQKHSLKWTWGRGALVMVRRTAVCTALSLQFTTIRPCTCSRHVRTEASRLLLYWKNSCFFFHCVHRTIGDELIDVQVAFGTSCVHGDRSNLARVEVLLRWCSHPRVRDSLRTETLDQWGAIKSVMWVCEIFRESESVYACQSACGRARERGLPQGKSS